MIGIVEQARRYVGQNEPTNDEEFKKEYMKIVPKEKKYSWSTVFNSICAILAGIPSSIVPTYTDCESCLKWFVRNGRFENSKSCGGTYDPKTNDIIFYSSKHTIEHPTHSSIVVSSCNGNIRSIEANKNDVVGYRSIKESDKYIIGFGRVAHFL